MKTYNILFLRENSVSFENYISLPFPKLKGKIKDRNYSDTSANSAIISTLLRK